MFSSLTTGPQEGDDLPDDIRDLQVHIPVVYMLKKLEVGHARGVAVLEREETFDDIDNTCVYLMCVDIFVVDMCTYIKYERVYRCR